MQNISRRKVLCASGAFLGASVLGIRQAEAEDKPTRKLKVLVVGAHPDDPETGCGGTIARYADEGHDVAVLYLTRGEVGLKGKSREEAAEIRTNELEKACDILDARPLFGGQIDGHTEVTGERYARFQEIVKAENPDVVYTHWPIDIHRDHRAASLLTYDAWITMGKKFALYYYEVYTGIQTQIFRPTDYVDISETEPRKRKATMAHASQDPAEMYKLHDLMNQFRGKEFGCRYAEAFIRHIQGPSVESFS